jgi:hypothetical protein
LPILPSLLSSVHLKRNPLARYSISSLRNHVTLS